MSPAIPRKANNIARASCFRRALFFFICAVGFGIVAVFVGFVSCCLTIMVPLVVVFVTLFVGGSLCGTTVFVVFRELNETVFICLMFMICLICLSRYQLHQRYHCSEELVC